MSLFGVMGSVGAVVHQSMMVAHHERREQAAIQAQASRTRRQVSAVRGLAADLEAARLTIASERRRAEAAETRAQALALRVLELEAAQGRR